MIRMNKAQKWLSFFALSMTGGIIFQVAYIRFVYLEPTYTALNLGSQQYGNIISAFGAVAIVMYFFGGWFSDKFSPKLLIVISLAGMGIADLYLATVPGFWGIVAAHILMAVVGMGLYWSALVKSISMLGDSDEQGRLFGFLEGTRGIVSTAIGFIGTAIVSASVVPAHGVLTLIRIYGVLSFVFAAVVLLVVREDRTRLAGLGSAAVTLKQLLAAARNRYTWLIGGTAMLMYCFYTTLGYFSPLLQDNYGVSASMIAVIGVVRSYVFQFVAGPAGGVVVDKVTRSSAVFLRWMFAGGAVLAALFLVLPRTASLAWLALVMMFVLCALVFASRGVYWSTVGEVEVPEQERGGVIGLASGLAYLPDAFLPSLCAWWIGDSSASPKVPEQGGGYSALFVFLLVAALLGLVMTTLTARTRRRELAARDTAPVVERVLAGV